MDTWSLATVVPAETGAATIACLTPDHHVRGIPPLARFTDLRDVFDAWPDVAEELRRWDPFAGPDLGPSKVSAPLGNPRKLICAGANYRDHLREMGIPELPPGLEPYFFLLPSTSITGPATPIVIPRDRAARVDWEAELAVVIGRAGRHIRPDEALNHVAGYTIMNDVSARGWHGRPNPLAPPFAYDWLASKGSDSFSPMGPGITPAWFVPDPQGLRVRLWLNGTLKQDASTKEMIFSVVDLIVAASALMTLEPGDIIATGTPAGVGVARREALSAGDTMTVEIESLGVLENPVVEDLSEPVPPVQLADSAR